MNENEQVYYISEATRTLQATDLYSGTSNEELGLCVTFLTFEERATSLREQKMAGYYPCQYSETCLIKVTLAGPC